MQLPVEQEKKLVEKLTKGDDRAFHILYNAYAPTVFARIKRLLHNPEWVEEIHQDVFLKIWHARVKIDPNVPFKAIILRTTKSIVVDFYRKALRDKKMKEQLVQIASNFYVEDFFPTEDSELNVALKVAIDALPPQRKKIFCMIKLEGKKYLDVADELNISPSTVKDHMAKAMSYLKSELKGKHSNMLLSIFFFAIVEVFVSNNF